MMKRKKLLKMFTEFFEKEERKNRKRQAELRKLVDELKQKEDQLEGKLCMERDEQKRLQIGEKLKVVKAQYAKGVKTLHGIEST